MRGVTRGRSAWVRAVGASGRNSAPDGSKEGKGREKEKEEEKTGKGGGREKERKEYAR